MKRRKMAGVLALFFAVVMLMTAYGDTQASQKKSGMTKIVIAECCRSEGWLPVYLAQELGYFKKEGLAPKFITFKDGPVALMALIGGEAQFCTIGIEPVLMAFQKGQRSKVLFTTTNRQPYTFVSRPGLKLADFKGKIVFAGMAGSAPYFFVKTILRNAGLNPDKDITFANLAYGAEITALRHGDIDGAYVRATRFREVQNAGATVLVDTTDPAQHKKVYGSEWYDGNTVQVTDEYIKSHPRIIQAFCNAVYKAMVWQTTHSDEEVSRKVTPFFPGRNIDAPLIHVLRKSLSSDGQFTQKGYDAVINFCIKNNIIRKAIPMSEVVDQSFIQKARSQTK